MDNGRSLLPHLSFGIEGSLSGPSVLFKDRGSAYVLVRPDNRIVITYLNHMGGPSLWPLCQLVLKRCLFCQITVRAEYLPGKENAVTDFESRSPWQQLGTLPTGV